MVGLSKLNVRALCDPAVPFLSSLVSFLYFFPKPIREKYIWNRADKKDH